MRLLTKKWSAWTKGRNLKRAMDGELIQIPETDYYRLMKLAAACSKKKAVKMSRLLLLRRILSSADISPVTLLRPDIVTMNTKLQLRTTRGRLVQCRLVYPEEEDRAKGWISVLSWAGLSLLGRKAGADIRFGLRINSVTYQPEINNAFHL